MRVGIFVPEEPEMHVEALTAFATGLRKLNVNHCMAKLSGGWRPCDVAVTFGIAKEATPRGKLVGKIAADQNTYGGDHLVIERGFLRRERYFMVGWGGLNGRADFRNKGMPSDRWDELRLAIKPWRAKGTHVVLCGQVPWDASVQHADHCAWCRDAAVKIRKLTDRPIIFRPHPLQREAVDMSGTDVVFSTKPRLEEDLNDAWCVVSFNSNSAVEAAILGIPVFACDRGSMAWPIASRKLEHIDNPKAPDRQEWLNGLAYTQWTIDEMKRGLPWMHLSKDRTSQTVKWYRRCFFYLFPSLLNRVRNN